MAGPFRSRRYPRDMHAPIVSFRVLGLRFTRHLQSWVHSSKDVGPPHRLRALIAQVLHMAQGSMLYGAFTFRRATRGHLMTGGYKIQPPAENQSSSVGFVVRSCSLMLSLLRAGDEKTHTVLQWAYFMSDEPGPLLDDLQIPTAERWASTDTSLRLLQFPLKSSAHSNPKP